MSQAIPTGEFRIPGILTGLAVARIDVEISLQGSGLDLTQTSAISARIREMVETRLKDNKIEISTDLRTPRLLVTMTANIFELPTEPKVYITGTRSGLRLEEAAQPVRKDTHEALAITWQSGATIKIVFGALALENIVAGGITLLQEQVRLFLSDRAGISL